MGFQLTICEGNEVGRQFDFDQPSVLLGRTHECDVPLYEAGVSRGHARIFLEGGVWLLEDLGSANGTLVNGRQVARHTLEEGDAITIGPVVLTWRPGPLDAATAGEPGVHHTRLLSVAERQRSTSRALEMLSAGGPSEELAELAVRGAHEPLALQPTRLLDPGGAQLDLATREHDVNTAEAGLAALSPREEHLALTAAERARLKRQGALGRLWLWWAEASPRRKRVTAVSATLLLVGVVVSVAAALPNADPKQQPLEPTTLSSEPDGVSFGLGEGVTFPREDEKRFEFRVRSPVRVVAVLHYQCKDIARDEVTLTVNGHELGTLPADTLQVDERTHELLPEHLRSPSTPLRARAAAGLHRRARASSTWPPCATRSPPRAATREGNPLIPSTWSSTTRCRSITSAATRLVRPTSTPILEYEPQHRTLPVPEVGPNRAPRTSARAAGPASCHQVNLEYLAKVVFEDGRPETACSTPTRWSAPTRTPP
jgi:hypothetical protein